MTEPRYIGCWREVNNSEYAGFTHQTYATEAEAVRAAEATCSTYRPCVCWAIQSKGE